MEELFKIAKDYYKSVGFSFAIKNRPFIFILFIISTILLVISIIVIFRYPLKPISFKDFIKSLGGSLYVTSLVSTFITYGLLERSMVRDLDNKRKIISSLLNCQQEEFFKILEKYNTIFQLYKKYNQAPKINFYHHLERFFIWIFSTVVGLYITLNFRDLKTFLKWINSKDFWFLVVLLSIVIIYYSLFRHLIPYWFKKLITIIDDERKIELFLADLTLLVKIVENKPNKPLQRTGNTARR